MAYKPKGFAKGTEVKTNHGWKDIRDIDMSEDLIFSIDPETNEMEYVRPTKRLKSHFDGEMLQFKNRRLNVMVTPDTEMLALRSGSAGHLNIYDALADDNFGRTPVASEMLKTWCVPLEGFVHKGVCEDDKFTLPSIRKKSDGRAAWPEKEIDLKAWLEWFGMWLADGHVTHHEDNGIPNYTYRIAITQHESNEEYILQLWNNIGYSPSKACSHNDTYHYYVTNKQLWSVLHKYGKARDKYIPDEFLNLPIDYLEVLLKGITLGDSSLVDNRIRYTTMSLRQIECLQELILKVTGHLYQYRFVYNKNRIGPLYVLDRSILKGTIKTTGYKSPKKVEYHDNVYHLQLEKNGIMLTRYEGIATWCRDYHL